MRHRQALTILGVALVLLAGWRGMLVRFHLRADFGESNYRANRIRIERYLQLPQAPAWVLVGSSLSGRLRSAAFANTPLADIAVLGLDGSTPLVGMVVLTNRADLPRVVLVETYTLNGGWKTNDPMLLDDLHSPGLKLARADPLFAAEQRPSSLLYSTLKEWRDPSAKGSMPRTNATAFEAAPAEPVETPRPESLAPLRSAIAALQARGVVVVLVDLLAGEQGPTPLRTQPDSAELIAQEFGLGRIDLRAEWFRRGWVPTYTDSKHLDAASADAAARLLAEVAPGLVGPLK